MAKVLDGKKEADKILARLKKLCAGRRPVTLATIIVGNRPDSRLYIKLKTAAARRVGIRTKAFSLPATATQGQLESLIQKLNRQRAVHGILLQLPLPSHLHADHAVATISPKKDVDGFRLNSLVPSPTIFAVLRLLEIAKPQPNSAITILGRDSVFTEQLAEQLARQKHRVFIVAPRHDWSSHTKQADVIITVLGRGPRLEAKDTKSSAIVIDVGIRRVKGKTVGDVALSVWKKAKAVSPVPGGIGPLTVAGVLWNTYQLVTRHLSSR
ncbi:MAG: bifunctional 5,10-methylenetetrahydrofolate dehydrogenase/5,10-methenyltetrahydrofolate cyclohydrolase [Candidatus Kerfeldbacteria bacterium]|nr:bifunctional 5,10-methylenetetrahydrofolate dehydrogenase/5,10-methenyltetrahydrofolate cyclohydrolase [Candidatus Kerfeldbacteria bacterium]